MEDTCTQLQTQYTRILKTVLITREVYWLLAMSFKWTYTPSWVVASLSTSFHERFLCLFDCTPCLMGTDLIFVQTNNIQTGFVPFPGLHCVSVSVSSYEGSELTQDTWLVQPVLCHWASTTGQPPALTILYQPSYPGCTALKSATKTLFFSSRSQESKDFYLFPFHTTDRMEAWEWGCHLLK